MISTKCLSYSPTFEDVMRELGPSNADMIDFKAFEVIYQTFNARRWSRCDLGRCVAILRFHRN